MLKNTTFYFGCLLIISTVLNTVLVASDPNFNEQVYLSTPKALKASLPGSEQITSENISLNTDQKKKVESMIGWTFNSNSFTLYKGYIQGKLKGFAIILNEMGKHYPITFITAITPDFKVSDVKVMVYRESYGDKVRKRRFLKQFINKSSQDNLMVNQDIDGMTGATISSWSITSGVKKAIAMAEVTQ